MKKDPMIISETKEEREKELNYFFTGNKELLEKLKRLDEKKNRIKELKKEYGPLEEPLVITISGTPRAGKTTCIENLFEFLKKSDMKTSCLEEPAGLVYKTLQNKEEKKELLKDRVGFVERQFEIGEEHITNALGSNDIILCDRGILDTFIWYNMYYKLGLIDENKYQEFLRRIEKVKSYDNLFYALHATSDCSMRRDYLSSLSIEQRTTMNRQNVDRYNEAMLSLMPTFYENVPAKLIETTKKDRMEASIIIANQTLDIVENKYVRSRR